MAQLHRISKPELDHIQYPKLGWKQYNKGMGHHEKTYYLAITVAVYFMLFSKSHQVSHKQNDKRKSSVTATTIVAVCAARYIVIALMWHSYLSSIKSCPSK